MNWILDYRERAGGLGVGGAAPNWRRARVALSARKPEVFKVRTLRNLIFFIRRRALYRAKLRRLELMRRVA